MAVFRPLPCQQKTQKYILDSFNEATMNIWAFTLAMPLVIGLLTGTNADFDMKATLLAHRAQYTNHLEVSRVHLPVFRFLF